MNRHDRREINALDHSLKLDYLHDLLDGHKLLTLYCRSCMYFHHVKLKCGDRFCTSCRRKEYGRLYKRYLPVLKHSRYLVHLTLTIKNYAYLDRDKVRECNRWLRQFFNHPVVRSRFRGALSCQEIIHSSDSKGWNHHVHILADMLYLSQADISTIWKEISGSSVCWIKKSEGADKDLRYLLKYMFKPPFVRTDGDLQVLKDDYNKAFFGSRSVNSHGSFFSSKELSPDEPFLCPNCRQALEPLLDLALFFDHAPVIKPG